MYTFTENSLDLQIAMKVYSLLELAREALGVFFAMCFWLTDHILNVVNRGFLKCKISSCRRSHSEVAASAVSAGGCSAVEQRGWMSISRSQSWELWQKKLRRREKRPRNQQPVQPLVEQRPSGKNVTGGTAESGSLPAEHHIPTIILLNLTQGNKAWCLWQPHIAEVRAEVWP